MTGLPDRYSYHVDPDADTTVNKVLRLVGESRRVLELGPASGSMTRALVELNHCTLVAVELDPTMAEQARPFCERLILANLETLDWQETFGDDRFDVIIAADVLEHLVDPWACLRAMRGQLRPGGFIVLSIPNIAHGAVLGQLLRGRFPYQQKGLLDYTHLRFFTRFDVEDMLLSCGFLPAVWDRNRVMPGDTEFGKEWQQLPEPLREALAGQADADTYQFILSAYPSDETGWITQTREAMARAKATQERLEQELQETRQRAEEYRLAYEESSRVVSEFRRYAEEQREAYTTTAEQMAEWRASSEELAKANAQLAQERETFEAAFQEYRQAYDENGKMLQAVQASYGELAARLHSFSARRPVRWLNRLLVMLGQRPLL